MEFPANSHKDKEGDASKKQIKEKEVVKVVSSEVVQLKVPLGRRFKNLFLGADSKSAARYIIGDVLEPAIRNLIVDMTSKGIERIVYGESASRPRNAHSHSRVSYNSPVDRSRSRGRGTMMPDQPPYSGRRQQQQRPDGGDIILVSREDAEVVLERLIDITDKYEVASVADFHDLVGLPTTFVDNKWGWNSLRQVEVHQVREGYIIDLPSAEPI